MEESHSFFERPRDPENFDAIRIRIASPEKIRSWSHGEVTKPETINYRTFKPERGGLFCAKIFGPIKDWECICGKYKRMKHRGVVCDKCGVEVIQSKVRRERLGHIELACPVSHVWFFKGLPSRIGHLLDMSLRDLERILYFENYVVMDPLDTPLKFKELLDEERYQELRDEYGDQFRAGMGAEAIRELLTKIKPEELGVELRAQMLIETSVQKRKKTIKRLKVVDALRKSGNRPEWMILEVIPVIPPELRPLVPLDGGRFATSDLNDLYRRVINRNNRLRRLQELKAPDVIIRNEKRMLQESVDALFDNGRRGRTLKGPNNRPLRSLSDMLKGKQGRFRQNLLGKRVDYSGRSVIVVGPDLRLNQCGLPKKMALELFKPFIFAKLEERGFVTTLKQAKRMVEQERDEVWAILEEVIQEHPVMLNRAPTLHRLGIQAFKPLLVEGKAIKIHPLVCAAFNADFDGDQMAVHLPLSPEAQLEAHYLMMASHNIISPASGHPIAVPSQDIVLGCYYLTCLREGEPGEGMTFANPEMALLAYDNELISLQARIKVRIDKKLLETSAGRIIFNDALPEPFGFYNRLADKKALSNLVLDVFRRSGKQVAVQLLDQVKDVGFEYATRAGVSISMQDMIIPAMKEELLGKANASVIEIEQQYLDGVITAGERYNKVVDIWSQTTDAVAEEMVSEMQEPQQDEDGLAVRESGAFNSIFMMATSGARGGMAQIKQLAGMRGLMAKPSGEIIETPITANFREGLTVLQYFISTHGARKGLADTALKTADSGYLTRRLVDVAQDVIITEEDCGTLEGIYVSAIVEGGEVISTLADRILGRVALEDVIDPFTKRMLVEANDEINEEKAELTHRSNLEKVRIRSVLTCEAKHGVCARCYGRNLATGRMVSNGEAVGVIAAQSIGEPGTQLTMRTFHIGGTARAAEEALAAETKTPGIIRLSQLTTSANSEGEMVVLSRKESRIMITQPSIVAVESGTISLVAGERDEEYDDRVGMILTLKGTKQEHIYNITPQELLDPKTRDFEGKLLLTIRDGQSVKTGQVLAERVREHWGVPEKIPYGAKLRVSDGQIIQPTVRAEEAGILKVCVGVGGELTPAGSSRSIVAKDGKVKSKCVYVVVMDSERDDLELQRVHIVPGAKLVVADGEQVTKGQILASSGEEVSSEAILLADWDPFVSPILAEADGVIHFEDVVDGVTISEERDKRSGQVRSVVGLYSEEMKCPTPECEHRETKRREGRRQYCPVHQTELEPLNPQFQVEPLDIKSPLPTGAHLFAESGQEVKAGDVIAIVLRETQKTKDITGGLPRVVELFEARRPKDPAVIAEIDGSVHFGPIQKGLRRVVITSDQGVVREYDIPKGTHINVHEGDRVRAGEALMDGAVDPHDILAVLGEKELMKYLVDEVQEVYRLQGVTINDKHVETIVRQMLRMIRVTDVGDTSFVLEQMVEKQAFRGENEEVITQGGIPSMGAPVLLGITKASLSTESFISAASFQETTRVLTEAAISGKVDHLRGLKENVVVGRLIPAGTGASAYRTTRIQVEMAEDVIEPESQVPEEEIPSTMEGIDLDDLGTLDEPVDLDSAGDGA